MNEDFAIDMDSDNQGRVDIKKHFDDLANNYDEKLFSRPPFQDLFMKKKDFVLSNIIDGKVLEVGAGTGQYTEILAEVCDEVVVMDVSRSMLSVNKNRCDTQDNIRFIQDDITNTGLQSNSFDGVVALAVLYHVPDWRGALSEIARLLKPGGELIAEFFNTTNPAVKSRTLLWRLQQMTGGAIGEFFEAPIFGTTYPAYKREAVSNGFDVLSVVGFGFLDLYRLTPTLDFLPANTIVNSNLLQSIALRLLFKFKLTNPQNSSVDHSI